MSRTVHLYDLENGNRRSITTFGTGGTQVKRRPTEVETAPLPPEEIRARADAVRELTLLHSPEQLAHREVLKRLPIQKLITAAIEQGLFDRLKSDG